MLLLSSVAGSFDFVFEHFVNEGVDAADEEAGNRGDVADIFAGGMARFECADKCVGDLAVVTEREDKGDIDIDAFGERLANRGDTRGCRRYLDHEVGAIHRFPEATDL